LGKRSNRDERHGKTLQKKLLIFSFVCFIVLAVRLFALQLVQHDHYAKFAEDNQLQRERITAPRGLIEDTHGKILVDNIPRYEIVVPWESERRMLARIRYVMGFFSLDSTAVLSNYDSWKKRNAGLPFPVIMDADKIVISVIRENGDLFPKLKVHTKVRRHYRYEKLAAHVLGYVGQVTDENVSGENRRGYMPGDIIGKMGLESACEEYLRGFDGQRVIEVNAAGAEMGELREMTTPPVPGETVRLTIDADLQLFLETLLEKWETGAAVVMSVDDGAVIAAASLPQFDPNSFAAGIKQAEWDELFTSKKKPLFNRILQASYPPGSTLKIVTAAAALENDIVARDRVLVYCTGAHKFGNRIFRCWKEEGHGYMNLYSGIVQSCDSYFYELAEGMDVDELANSARNFGLGAKTDFDLQGETMGLVPDREYYDRRFGKGKWTQGQMLNNAIGQGEFLTTILQMCRVSAAVANGGYLVEPHVVQSINGKSIREHERKKIPGLSAGTLQFLQRAVRGVVGEKQGTAQWVRTRGITFAGKTGTSQNPHGEDHAWFISYAPAENPEIAMAVIVENAGHGGTVAAPITRDFYRRYFLPDSSESVSLSKPPPVSLPEAGEAQ
jgi:penicillin-binding protein 2